MASWNGLVVRPSIGEDGELSEPEAPAGARFPLPALPARAELRDAEVHAMLGELDFGESAVMGDATAEELQARSDEMQAQLLRTPRIVGPRRMLRAFPGLKHGVKKTTLKALRLGLARRESPEEEPKKNGSDTRKDA
jgi:hypothetical protein